MVCALALASVALALAVAVLVLAVADGPGSVAASPLRHSPNVGCITRLALCYSTLAVNADSGGVVGNRQVRWDMRGWVGQLKQVTR